MAIERQRIFYGGHVQGVGFRMRTRRLTEGLAVAGYVRNLDDGRVELLIEGDPVVCAGLMDAVAREFGASITNCEVVPEPPGEPPLVGFSIR